MLYMFVEGAPVSLTGGAVGTAVGVGVAVGVGDGVVWVI
jgi:phosphate/sulfate permease